VGDGKISAIVGGVGDDESDHEGEDESDGEHGGSGAKEKGGRLITTGGAEKFQKNQFNLTRSLASHGDMSERMTLSPGWSPLTISMVLTELRPSFTCVRVA
jgi:hypothetical protein